MLLSIKRNSFQVLFAIIICTLIVIPNYSLGQLTVEDVDVFWEDSLIIVQPEIHHPFTDKTLETLQSGVNVALDVEIQFIRTGYVKREFIRVPVQYNVFTDRYRVTTPISPLAVNDYTTVLTLFKNDLIFIIDEKDLPKKGEWFVKVRAGERILLEGDDGAESISKIEDDLSGIAAWFFKRGKEKDKYCEWSRLASLPEKPE